MKKIVTGALAALSLVGAAAGTATPAAAQPWHGSYFHGGYGGWRGGDRGWGSGAAVGAGLVGLAVGASLASTGYGYGYGAPYYRGGYYAPVYGYGYGCRIVGRWGRWGYHRVRACY